MMLKLKCRTTLTPNIIKNRRFESKVAEENAAPSSVYKRSGSDKGGQRQSDQADPSKEKDTSGVEFRVLQIFPPKETKTKLPIQFDKTKLEFQPPRYTRMSPNIDWPSVWPTAHSFKASVVPLPITMGFRSATDQKTILPPKKYANLELIKIPNFLHLTPLAIQRHCAALQKFCTKWPEELAEDEQLEKHFPIELTYSDILLSGPSVREPRARIVNLKVRLSRLNLDEHAKLKFIALVGKERYDKKTDTVSITSERCPARHQNRDYVMYLLTALYHQSWKLEEWEKDMAEEDRIKYYWDGTRSKRNVVEYAKMAKQLYETGKSKKKVTGAKDALEASKSEEMYDEFVKKFTDEKQLEEFDQVQTYKNTIENFKNEGETDESIKTYASATRKLFGLPKLK